MGSKVEGQQGRSQAVSPTSKTPLEDGSGMAGEGCLEGHFLGEEAFCALGGAYRAYAVVQAHQVQA